ncbi:MAG TPA: hypothetical protein VGM88_02135 [Kofleriaceae bacterium]
MHDGSVLRQGLASAAAQCRRIAAAVALIVGAREAAADPQRPLVTLRGWELSVTGYAQVDGVAYSQESENEIDPATGATLNEYRVYVPRARVRFDARRDAWGVTLEFDGNTLAGTPEARLLGAAVSWTGPARAGIPLVAVTAGLIKIPFGADVPAPERDKPFLEQPAISRALFPLNYDAGVMAAGGYGMARWSVAVMNGSPVADGQWHGTDPTSSFDVIGRLGAVVDAPDHWRVEAGVSGLTGQGLHAGTQPTKDQLQWVDENMDGIVQTTELQVIPGQPGEPSQTFHRNAVGADVQVHWCLCGLGNGTAFAEGALATNLDRGLVYADPIARARDLRELGYAIGVVQDLGAHGQAGVRWDWYDADRDANEVEGATTVGTHEVFSQLSIMGAVRWRDVRLMAQFDVARNPFGRADSGAPASLAADKLTLRAQVGF